MGKQQDIKIQEIAQDLFNLKFDDQTGIDNYFFEKMFDQYLGLHCKNIEKWIDTIFEKQTDKKRSYGDIDWSVTILKNDDSKRVLFFDNHVTCASETKFIIIQDVRKDYKKTTHFRMVWNNSDYKKGNQYVHRPNLKWYKDRGFDLNFNDKLHMTPLGGSYGDCRDHGFLMTFKKDILSNMLGESSDDPAIQKVIDSIKEFNEGRGDYDVEDGSLYRYSELKRAIFDLNCSANELNNK